MSTQGVSDVLAGAADFSPLNGSKRLRVTHLITGLGMGGAEGMLCKLLSRMGRDRFENDVISLTTDGPMAQKLSALGVPVRIGGMTPGRLSPTGLLRLGRMIRNRQPDILQTWMPHSDLAGGLIAWFFGEFPVIWNIRHTAMEGRARKLMTEWTISSCARLSARIPETILSCSEVSLRYYAEQGYCRHKMQVIPNGFDTDMFRPDPDARSAVRRELGIADTMVVIGRVGRFHPQKDHECFIKCAKAIIAEFPDTRFVVCGQDISWDNGQLASWIDRAGMREFFYLLDCRTDMHRLYPAFDLTVSSSAFGEAFPNVVGEAMACGVPCVVTDVGDSASIVADTGLAAPPRDPNQLAAHCIHLLRTGPTELRHLGMRARQRILHLYSLSSVAKRYEDLYCEVYSRAQNLRNSRQNKVSYGE